MSSFNGFSRSMRGSLSGSEQQPFSIRERQKTVLFQMLANAASGVRAFGDMTNTYTAAVWKVLVFDDRGGDIMYLLMRVKDLRAAGVTLSLRLEDSSRQRLEDVPAVYFIEPTPEALDIIAKDLGSRALYSSAYVHAISAFDRKQLEAFAQAAVREDAQSHVAKVFDQYSDFLSLENDLFVTGRYGQDAQKHLDQLTYNVFNGNGIPDDVVEATVSRIARSLFGVVLAMGVVPIIRAPRDTAAAAVAEALHKSLQSFLANASSATAESCALLASAALQRPLLLICDRNIDLGVMFAHPWHYRGLVSELMDFDLNKVTIDYLSKEDPSSGSGPVPGEKLKKPLHFEFDTRTDKFWAAQCGSAFPEMAVCLDNEVKGYKAASDEISKYSHNAGVDPSVGVEDLTDSDLVQHGLQKFANRVPQLRETKMMIDAHTTVAHELMMRIKRTRLDEFFELEDNLLRSSGYPSSDVTTRVRNIVCTRLGDESYSLKDRMRLFLIWYFAVNGASAEASTAEARTAMESALSAAGADMRPYAYAQKIKQFMTSASSMRSSTSAHHLSTSSSGGSDSSSGMVSAAFEKLMHGVKALMPRNQKYRVARTVEALMDLRGASLGIEDEYLYLDPKLSCEQIGPGAVAVPRKTTPFKDAIVFVVGGGNYVEHQNVVDLCRRPAPSADSGSAASAAATATSTNPQFVGTGKRIIYGTTELLTPSQFVEQFSSLGSN